MARFRAPSLFTILPLEDARKLTGLDAAALQDSPQVQLLTRVSADGQREPALRIPNELLLDHDTEK
jgi:hypothetical protein